jgi:hypothetical protein
VCKISPTVHCNGLCNCSRCLKCYRRYKNKTSDETHTFSSKIMSPNWAGISLENSFLQSFSGLKKILVLISHLHALITVLAKFFLLLRKCSLLENIFLFYLEKFELSSI